MKKCNTCGFTKPYSAFNKRVQEKDGYNYKCRECMRAYRQKWKRAEACCALRRKYGISLAEYEELAIKQGNACAICHVQATKEKRLAVDHNHTTGEVRGLLCGPCNQALGLLADSPSRVSKALKYLTDKGHYGLED